MAYTKAGMKAVDKYVRENYSRLNIKIPIAQREPLESFCNEHNESVNGMVNRLIRTEMGISEDDWGNNSEMKTIAQLRRILKSHGDIRLRNKHRGKDSWEIVDNTGAIIEEGDIEAGGLTIAGVADWITYMGWDLN